MFQPSLAKMIGLHEAIVLQTIRFWCGQKKSGKVIEDERWIYNTLEQWREFSFPFWSTRTIGEIFRTLEKMGLIKSRQFDLMDGKAMKYYTLTNIAYNFLTSERLTHSEESSEPMWKNLPDHVEDSSRSARASFIKNITEKQTEKLPLPPHGEAEDSAMASSSASDSDLISDSVNAANAGIGKANAFDSRPPHQSNSKGCAVRKKSPPKEVDSEFINSLKKLNPRIDVDAQLTKMETWLLANPSRQKTRKFVSGWINRCAEKLPPIPKQETFDDIDWANVKPNQ